MKNKEKTNQQELEVLYKQLEYILSLIMSEDKSLEEILGNKTIFKYISDLAADFEHEHRSWVRKLMLHFKNNGRLSRRQVMVLDSILLDAISDLMDELIKKIERLKQAASEVSDEDQG